MSQPPERPAPPQDPVIVQWYAGSFVPRLQAAPLRFQDRAVSGRLGELLGRPLPRELADLVALNDGRCLFLPEGSAWTMDIVPPALLPQAGDANPFFELVRRSQGEGSGLSLSRWFAALLPLGQAPGGDEYQAHLNDRDPERSPVLLVDGRDGEEGDYVADSIAAFAYLNHLQGQWAEHGHRGGEASRRVQGEVLEGLRRLSGRAILRGPFRDLATAVGSDLGSAFDRPARALQLRDRAAWIVELLRGEPFSRKAFQRVDQRRFDVGAAFAHEDSKSYLPVALYWPWRLFFLREPELPRALEFFAGSSSALVRGAVALVEELERGRRDLGVIPDVHRLRDVAVEAARGG